MQLNIKNPNAHRLASELAALTGESMAKAVTEAIRERLARERKRRDKQAKFERLMEIAREFSGNRDGEVVDLAAVLYDEQGLPR